MIEEDDRLLFEPEDPAEGAPSTADAWTILIIDDEEDVHDVTRYALNGALLDNRPIRFLSARSAAEARDILRSERDIGMILLDVVMESDRAGLDLIPFIRNELQNRAVRIILRTGQPGQAPERQVVLEYDINDYKMKSELTAQKLFTSVISSLRSYRDIQLIEQSKQGLEQIIKASPDIFEHKSFERFAKAVLDHMSSLIGQDNGVYAVQNRLVARCDGPQFEIIAATGRYESLVGERAKDVLPPEILADFEAALSTGDSQFGASHITAVCMAEESSALLHLDGVKAMSDLDRRLIDVYTRNVGVAFHNLLLRDDIDGTQREIVCLLSETVETRSKETGNHVRRMARYSRILAELAGMPAIDCDLIEYAAPLHDIGKIGIPDAILNKPGRHTPEETLVMRTHAQIGADMLRNSRRPILQTGAIVAGEHHERWDGTGYPHGKKGTDIHIFGRICALADVFDALTTARCYKTVWTMDETLDLIRRERGGHFDPALVDLLTANLERFTSVMNDFPDP